jgi:hypothetical protein
VGCLFTWSSKRPSPSFYKLDRVLLSPHWTSDQNSDFHPSLVDLPASTSDHAPLQLSFRSISNIGTKTFKLERYWLKYQELHDLVAEAWTTPNPSNVSVVTFLRRMSSVRWALSSWARTKFVGFNSFLCRSKWVLQFLDRAEESRALNNLVG